jgi:hypothetical protein
LYDWYEEAGATHDEYFWQDLIVARLIFIAKPEKHVDIGSREPLVNESFTQAAQSNFADR